MDWHKCRETVKERQDGLRQANLDGINSCRLQKPFMHCLY